jgi:hypothetical protein
MGFLLLFLELMTGVLIIVVGVAVLVLAVLDVIDVTQTEQAVRRNYPVLGRFRYLFEHLGEFFPTVLLCHGPGRTSISSRAAFLVLSCRQKCRQYGRVWLNSRLASAWNRAVCKLLLSNPW